MEPLLHNGAKSKYASRSKRYIWFGYLPIWSECVPLKSTGETDWEALVLNVVAGFIMGVREALGGIVSASLVFSSTGHRQVTHMLPWGISMTLYTMSFAVFWYAIFGRLQYAYSTQQDLICILQAELAAHVADQLQATPEKIPATVVAVIMVSSILSGIVSVLTGKLGLGNYMLLFPKPVTDGFLGAIGVVVVRAAFSTSSGVKFHEFYPSDVSAFLTLNSLAQVGCMFLHVCCIRLGPALLIRCAPRYSTVQRMGNLVCQLAPLLIFYVICSFLGINLSMLTAAGWTYPAQGNIGPLGLWTTYKLSDADSATIVALLPEMPSIVLMSILCTMLGALAITDAFPNGPTGDPAPLDPVDFNTELTVVGASSVLLGLTGGNLNFHKFSAIQMRLDGGTHRIGVMVIALLAGGLFLSGLPIGQLVPKWFLSGLFLNTGIHFLKNTILAYRTMSKISWRGYNLPAVQYWIGPFSIMLAVFASPTTAILISLVVSIAIFLVNSSEASPVVNVVFGNNVVSRTKRPFWEMQVLRRDGDRIILVYLQGQLFFGSVRHLISYLEKANASCYTDSADYVSYCILSFARVSGVDPSAAKHLKTAATKMKFRGCRFIYCRMNQAVYSALSAVGAVKFPDADLLEHLDNKRWKSVPLAPKNRRRKDSPRSPTIPSRKSSFEKEKTPTFVVAFESPTVRPARAPREFDESPPPPSVDSRELDEEQRVGKLPDAFAHETDALDFCDEQIVKTYYYDACMPEDLDQYVWAYRASAKPVGGVRLPEWAFEDMNDLPRGLMAKLRPFCQVFKNLDAWSKVSDQFPEAEGALFFILRGSLSIIQTINSIHPEVTGFSYREGKRLLKRYPPGHVAGKTGFFLTHSDKIIDADVTPKVVVSSKINPPAEVWVLKHEQWNELPREDLKGPLTQMLCMQFADDEQFSRIQEH